MIPNETIIRKATQEEAIIIHQLAKEIWPWAFEQILTPGQIAYMMQLMYSIKTLEDEMARGVEFYILNHQNKDQGYTAIEQKDADAYKLHKIYLSQQLHGKGLGKYQLKSMETIVKNYGATQLYLNVNRHNKAIDFYKSQGYIIIKNEDIAIGNGYFMNDYVMRKDNL